MAASCADAGLRVALVDPEPHRVWPHTYAAWLDELPPVVARAVVGTRVPSVHVVGTSVHSWARPYVVLDNAKLHEYLRRDDVQTIAARVISAEHGPDGSTVRLKNHRTIAAATVIDASGAARVLSGGRPARTAAQQSAVGLFLDPAAAEPLRPSGSAVFMDWRPAPGTFGGWPSFLYAVPLPDGQVLVEETSLARRPALPLALLRRRLHGRMAAAGVPVPDGPEERVRFPVDDPLPRPSRIVPFGATGGLVHPATGFSVAASLRLAPWVAAAIAAGLRSGPATAARAAWSVVWPPATLAANGLRRRALHALLALPPERVPEFFEVFFTIDEHHRRAFLSPDSPPAQTAAAMTAVFRSAGWPLRARLITGGLDPRHPPARHGFGGFGDHPDV